MTYYRQCVLVKRATQQVAWIPEEFAVVGKYVKLKEDDGWKVTNTSEHRQSEEYVQAHERDHMGHRRRTDI
jgi:hypothetical protein